MRACVRSVGVTLGYIICAFSSPPTAAKFGGSIGVLHVVRTAVDFDFIHNDPPAPPYTVVVPTTLFTREHIMPLQRASQTVAGIMLIRPAAGEPAPDRFSPELQCPNQYSTYNKATCDARRPETLWNPAGNGLLHVSFPFPIYFLDNPDEVRKVVDCFDRHNAPDPAGQHRRPLCSVQINQFMAATGNSEMCLRRSQYEFNMKPTRYCDALSGNSVYATLFPRDPVTPPPPTQPDAAAAETSAEASAPTPPASPTVAAEPEQFIVVCARLDSTGMFDGIAAGAMEVLPLVTVLSTAHTLAALLPERPPVAHQPNVLFALFNGESYDYIGSQRFVFDVRRGAFPPRHQRRAVIRPEQIQLVVDVAGLDDPSNVFAYHVRDFPLAGQLLSSLEKNNRAHALGVTVTGRLQDDQPPSAVQSFLSDNSTTWPTVALASPAANRYLHSLYDDADNVRFTYANTSADFERLEDVSAVPAADWPFANDSLQVAVRNVSTVLAFSLYELVTGRPYSGRLGASAVLADELLHCYLEATSCPLMRASVQPDLDEVGRALPPQRYISVGMSFMQESTAVTYALLGWLLGRRTNRTEEACGPLPWQWMAGWNGTGECRLGTQNLSMASSPAWRLKGECLPYRIWTPFS